MIKIYKAVPIAIVYVSSFKISRNHFNKKINRIYEPRGGGGGRPSPFNLKKDLFTEQNVSKLGIPETQFCSFFV